MKINLPASQEPQGFCASVDGSRVGVLSGPLELTGAYDDMYRLMMAIAVGLDRADDLKRLRLQHKLMTIDYVNSLDKETAQ